MKNVVMQQLRDVHKATVSYPHELIINTNRGMVESVELEDQCLENHTKGKWISSIAP